MNGAYLCVICDMVSSMRRDARFGVISQRSEMQANVDLLLVHDYVEQGNSGTRVIRCLINQL